MRRVVVTGLGAVTPVGNSVSDMWESLLAGKSGIAEITHFDVEKFTTKLAGEVKNFDTEEKGLSQKDAKRLDMFEKFAITAAFEAMQDSGLDSHEFDKERAGVCIGVGFGGIKSFEENNKQLLEKGPRRVSPFMITQMIANMGPGYVSMHLGFKGPQSCPVAACASGTYGVIDAFRYIREGVADVMVAGGAESAVSPMGVAGFMNMRALSKRNDDPQRASRPFDKDRDGFVPAEGAGMLILEELEHAKSRGAKIYAEVVGYGATSDAHHITQPAPRGEGGRRAMAMALKSAGIKPEDVAYINAHGTSTPFNDKFETMAIKDLFGDHAKKLKVNSTKSMVGHMLGAAGGVEAIVLALSIYHQKVHQTANFEDGGEDCDLDYVPGAPVSLPIRYALSNSLGFGGVNGVVAMKKFED